MGKAKPSLTNNGYILTHLYYCICVMRAYLKVATSENQVHINGCTTDSKQAGL